MFRRTSGPGSPSPGVAAFILATTGPVQADSNKWVWLRVRSAARTWRAPLAPPLLLPLQREL